MKSTTPSLQRGQPGFWLVVAVCCLLAASWCDACPTCKDAMAQGDSSGNLVQGYGWSIVFMMSMPFLILAGLGSYFYYEVRRARQAASPAPAERAMVRSESLPGAFRSPA